MGVMGKYALEVCPASGYIPPLLSNDIARSLRLAGCLPTHLTVLSIIYLGTQTIHLGLGVATPLRVNISCKAPHKNITGGHMLSSSLHVVALFYVFAY